MGTGVEGSRRVLGGVTALDLNRKNKVIEGHLPMLRSCSGSVVNRDNGKMLLSPGNYHAYP